MKRLARIVGMAALVAGFAGTSLWADPPPSSGSIVIRTETNIAWTYVDFQRGVRVVYGTNIVEWCNNTNTWDVVRLLEIDVPEDSNRLIDLVQGDEVTTSVWPFTAFDCSLFTTVTPLATGTTDLIITDNDLLVYLVDNNLGFPRVGGQLKEFDIVVAGAVGAVGNAERFPRS